MSENNVIHAVNAEGRAENTAAEVPTKEEQRQAREDALKKVEEIVANASTGKLELSRPFKSDGYEITELSYDFKAISGVEFADAMDTDTNRKSDSFRITGKQALALFAAATAKCEEHVDKFDVMRGLSSEDAVAAIQLATLFFRAASQAGDLRTLRG